jgi:hypothetical protein
MNPTADRLTETELKHKTETSNLGMAGRNGMSTEHNSEQRTQRGKLHGKNQERQLNEEETIGTS